MNVLQILPELNVGGVETGTLDLARHLVKRGNKAVVISRGGPLVKDLEEAGGIHYCLPVHNKSFFSMLRMIPAVAAIIRKEKIDIVHARSRMPAWIAYFACRRTRSILVTTCHGYYRTHFFSYAMGWGKRVIAISNVIARHMIDDFKVPHERIRLIPRSVDAQKFTFVSPDAKRRDTFHVGIIGRLTPLKGHLDFLKAMAKVYRQVPKLKIWIVGDAPVSKISYKEQVQVLTKRLGLWHCTEFLGTQKDIPAVMAQLDALVLATTTHEAFGRVIVEAQASGVPVVATRVGGVIDIIDDEKTGFLVPPSDPNRMAERILRVYHEPALCASIAEAAYLKLKEFFNVERMVNATLQVYQEAIAQRSILIIKLSSLGDIILSTAAIKAIREKFPREFYKITFLVGQDSKELLMGCPYIDELVVCDLRGRDKGFPGLWKLGRELRRRNFDLTIDLQNNRASHMLSYMTLAMDRYGYRNRKCGFLLNHGIKDEKPPIDPVTHQFRILKMLGIELQAPRLELWPDARDEEFALELLSSQWLSEKRILVGINISASPRWKTKPLSLARLAAICEMLGEEDIRVVLTGTEHDIPAARRLLEMLKGVRPIDVCGKTSVLQLAAVLKHVRVFVSSDSAPLHIAAAMGVPCVALFGPTDERRHMPPVASGVVIGKNLKCRPCYKPDCKTRECMESISAEEVVKAVNNLLGYKEKN